MFRLPNLTNAAPLTSRFSTAYAQLKRCSTRSCLGIEEQLRKKFKTIRGTLFQNFDTYKSSLPVRKVSGEYLKLHELPYFALDDDVQSVAKQLEWHDPDHRDQVKYVCAPAASGKTTSVLPAFLESGFTHYLYIAFDNNNGRQFKLSPSKPIADCVSAEDQGAAFAVECLRTLLLQPEKKGPHKIEIGHKDLPSKEHSTKELKELLDLHLNDQHRVLFHVDEHRKMCDRHETKDDPGASFSRGAMLALASCGTVVATYVEPLYALPPLGSSELCRKPVAMAQVDVEKFLQYHNLALPCATPNNPKEDERILAVLKFRIAMLLQPNGGLGLSAFQRLVQSERAKQFLEDLRYALKRGTGHAHAQQPIEKCHDVVNKFINIPDENNPSEYATRLLLGMSDEEVGEARGLNHLVVLNNAKLSTTVFRLLSFTEANEELRDVYRKGRDRFNAVLENQDMISGHPLEEAYLWTLSCSSAFSKALALNRSKPSRFDFHCTDIKPARIFPGQDPTKFDVSHLERGTMYYADERGRGDAKKPNHPCADMFFRTTDDKVVLIDITGGGARVHVEKVKKLSQRINTMRTELERASKWRGGGRSFAHAFRHTPHPHAGFQPCPRPHTRPRSHSQSLTLNLTIIYTITHIHIPRLCPRHRTRP